MSRNNHSLLFYHATYMWHTLGKRKKITAPYKRSTSDMVYTCIHVPVTLIPVNTGLEARKPVFGVLRITQA